MLQCCSDKRGCNTVLNMPFFTSNFFSKIDTFLSIKCCGWGLSINYKKLDSASIYIFHNFFHALFPVRRRCCFWLLFKPQTCMATLAIIHSPGQKNIKKWKLKHCEKISLNNPFCSNYNPCRNLPLVSQHISPDIHPHIYHRKRLFTGNVLDQNH